MAEESTRFHQDILSGGEIPSVPEGEDVEAGEGA